jgi:cell division cycle protein 37
MSRMIAKNPKSITMFNEDFVRTYNRIATRTVEILAEEKAAGEGEAEQIQLVAEDPNVKIGFNLPDGPPPADLRVEGEGSEQMDIEQASLSLTSLPSWSNWENRNADQ